MVGLGKEGLGKAPETGQVEIPQRQNSQHHSQNLVTIRLRSGELPIPGSMPALTRRLLGRVPQRGTDTELSGSGSIYNKGEV